LDLKSFLPFEASPSKADTVVTENKKINAARTEPKLLRFELVYI